MFAAFLPLIAKLLMMGLDFFVKKEADKSALRKKIEDKLRMIQASAPDSANTKVDYNSSVEELNKPEPEEKVK
jgi:hypothetical protein